MDAELSENALGMMAGGMGADVQSLGYRGVRPALGQQLGYFQFSLCKPVLLLQVADSTWGSAISADSASLLLKLPSDLTHFSQRFTKLREQQSAVPSELTECGK
jgi:hypothetical protein